MSIHCVPEAAERAAASGIARHRYVPERRASSQRAPHRHGLPGNGLLDQCGDVLQGEAGAVSAAMCQVEVRPSTSACSTTSAADANSYTLPAADSVTASSPEFDRLGPGSAPPTEQAAAGLARLPLRERVLDWAINAREQPLAGRG